MQQRSESALKYATWVMFGLLPWPIGLASRCILGSWDPQPVRTTHFLSLQHNMSCTGGMLLRFSQWEGEKEGRPFGGARRMNLPPQTAGQLADDR